MNTTLTVTDPLAAQEVTIIITLPPSEQPHDERPALISVGIAAHLPVIITGVFGEMAALINEAWTAFSVRAQVTESTQDVEIAADEQLLATANTNDDEPSLTPPSNLSAPKPSAQNLSLF